MWGWWEMLFDGVRELERWGYGMRFGEKGGWKLWGTIWAGGIC